MTSEPWMKTIALVPAPAPVVLRRAAVAVASRATGPDDLRLLLDALDLTPPRKGDTTHA